MLALLINPDWPLSSGEGADPGFTSFSFLSCVAAIDLINNLLQVKMRKRYSVDKTLSHPWLQVTTPETTPARVKTHTHTAAIPAGQPSVDL